MILWCYNDVHNWGAHLCRAAQDAGVEARMFHDAREPDSGVVFVHMHHQPQVRSLFKQMMRIMSVRTELRLIPSYRASVLFDDRLEQFRQLARWMPTCQHFYTPASARRWLEAKPRYPFTSRSSEGLSSMSSRLITTPEEATTEIRHAFSDIGIKGRHQITQRGYLIWHEFVGTFDQFLRVVRIGDEYMASARARRDDDCSVDTETERRAVAFAADFFEREDLRFGVVDLAENNDTWSIVEFSVRWQLHEFLNCRFVDREGRATGNTSDDIWNVIVSGVVRGTI